jgi:uncharacterized protein (TIGR02118 family)
VTLRGAGGQDSVPHPDRRAAYMPPANATPQREDDPMTAHLLILYPIPKDSAKFDRAYRDEHLPYAGPRLMGVGATGVKTQHVAGPAFAPPPYHLMSDISFPTLDVLKSCAASKEGKEALAHAASISSGGAPMLIVVTDAG